jgi:hypothetical protein
MIDPFWKVQIPTSEESAEFEVKLSDEAAISAEFESAWYGGAP